MASCKKGTYVRIHSFKDFVVARSLFLTHVLDVVDRGIVYEPGQGYMYYGLGDDGLEIIDLRKRDLGPDERIIGNVDEFIDLICGLIKDSR